MTRIFTSVNDLMESEIRALYDGLSAPLMSSDCGRRCAPHNPSGKPFCCDICHAVPAVYKREWSYLELRTELWHAWRGDECGGTQPAEASKLRKETPNSMVLLACLGPDRCQRDFRALSCRQFPFFPYVSPDYRFLGLACEWEFEEKCWVISNLARVTGGYRDQFVATFDKIFALFQDEFDSYAFHSERLREHYLKRGRRFPLLHRNGNSYLVSARSGRMSKVDATSLPNFGPYLK